VLIQSIELDALFAFFANSLSSLCDFRTGDTVYIYSSLAEPRAQNVVEARTFDTEKFASFFTLVCRSFWGRAISRTISVTPKVCFARDLYSNYVTWSSIKRLVGTAERDTSGNLAIATIQCILTV
jgi:hypothetical protein